MKTNELLGAALDWAVAKCEGFSNSSWDDERLCFLTEFDVDFEPSINWEQGGKIIERNRINLWCDGYGDWEAKQYGKHEMWAKRPLVAAMRCYVASKLGEEVDVPTFI